MSEPPVSFFRRCFFLFVLFEDFLKEFLIVESIHGRCQLLWTSLPSWLTVSSAGRFVRGLASRAESNGSVGSLNRSLSVLSSCSASPLTHEARLAESSNASEPMFAYEDRKVPEMEEVWVPF